MALDDLDFSSEDVDEDDDNLENTYLSFGVGGEEFAIHVAHVTEIVRLQKIFAVPDVATHVRGVINLRGKVIPLLDVRAKFGVPQAAYTDRTVIVVIEVGGAPTGLVVDSVFDITEIDPATIEPMLAGAQHPSPSLVTGVSNRGQRVCFLVAVEALVGGVVLLDSPRASAPFSPSARTS